VDRRTGKWVRGFEGTFREHNRYGYDTRVERRERRKAKREDLRDHLNRLRASSEERLTNDLERLKIAVRGRMNEDHRPSQRERNRPRASSAERIADVLERLSIRERDVGTSGRNRKRARDETRSPMRDNRERSPGAREMYRKIARCDRSTEDHEVRKAMDNEVRRALLEEEKLMDEERRTLWLEEEKHRTDLIEDEERRRLFWMEMKEAQEKMQESMQARLQEAKTWI